MVDLMSDFEVETLCCLYNRDIHDSHLPPLNHNHLELETIHLSDDSDSEKVSRNLIRSL